MARDILAGFLFGPRIEQDRLAKRGERQEGPARARTNVRELSLTAGIPDHSTVPNFACDCPRRRPRAREHWTILYPPMGLRLVMPLTSCGEKRQGCDLNHTRP